MQQHCRFLSASPCRSADLATVKADGPWVKDVGSTLFSEYVACIAVSAMGDSHLRVAEVVCRRATDLIDGNPSDEVPLPRGENARRITLLTSGSFPRLAFLSSRGPEVMEIVLQPRTIPLSNSSNCTRGIRHVG